MQSKLSQTEDMNKSNLDKSISPYQTKKTRKHTQRGIMEMEKILENNGS